MKRLPASSTFTLLLRSEAAVIVFRVAGLSFLWSCSAITRQGELVLDAKRREKVGRL